MPRPERVPPPRRDERSQVPLEFLVLLLDFAVLIGGIVARAFW